MDLQDQLISTHKAWEALSDKKRCLGDPFSSSRKFGQHRFVSLHVKGAPVSFSCMAFPFRMYLALLSQASSIGVSGGPCLARPQHGATSVEEEREELAEQARGRAAAHAQRSAERAAARAQQGEGGCSYLGR